MSNSAFFLNLYIEVPGDHGGQHSHLGLHSHPNVYIYFGIMRFAE